MIRKALITGGSEEFSLKELFGIFAQIGLIVKLTFNQFALLVQIFAVLNAIVIGNQKVALSDSILLM